MLRERKGRFDIVISDVNMPDMDGFKLLEQVGLEMDLPVIMMSVDGETSRVMKGVQHGACDYLLKPVRMKELRNIWQHVFRKKMHEVKEIENHDRNGESDTENRLEEFDEKHIPSGRDSSSSRKRKDVYNDYIEHNFNDSASLKKARVVWSVDLHQKFVNAVNQIGFDKVGPKKILDLMNIPGLTRENVASHLQKYRLYLSRLQKQNEGETFARIEQSDPKSKYPPGSFGLLSSMAMRKDNSPDNYGLFMTGVHLQDMTSKNCGDELVDVGSTQATERRFAINDQSIESQKSNNVPGFSIRTSSEEKIPGLDYKQGEICISEHHQSGYGENQVTQFTQLMKHDQESITLMKHYSHLQQANRHRHFGDDHLCTPNTIYSMTSSAVDSSSLSSPINPVDTYENNLFQNMTLEHDGDSISLQFNHGVVDTSEAASKTNGSSSPESYSSEYKEGISCWEPIQQKLNMKDEVDLTSSDDLIQCSLQSYGCFGDIGLNGFGDFEYSNQTAADIQSVFCDELLCNCGYLFDLLEVPTADDGLFT